MARGRYSNTRTIDGARMATWDVTSFRGFREHDILAGVRTFDHVLQTGERLDHLASRFFGDGSYWWVISLVNNIAFPLGVASGTVLRIPFEVRDVLDRVLP